MKKIFTLAIAALAALSVSAQDVATKQTLAFTGNAWNVNVLATGNVGITCNSQWGEYKLTSESFDAADYSSLHVEYSDLVQAEEGNGFQIILGNSSDTNTESYLDLDPNATSADLTIDPAKLGGKPINKIELQGKSKDSYVKVISAALVKADGSRTPLTFAGPAWGIDVDPLSTPTLQFTGQYGGQELVVAEDGSHVTYDPATEAGVEKVVVIKLSQPLGIDVKLENQNGGSGFAWIGQSTGSTFLTDTLNATTAVDATGAAKAVDQVWIKASSSEGYPSDVVVEEAYLLTGTHEAILAGIKNVKADAKALDENAPMYNLAGQQVTKAYKGVVIQNGRKFLNNK